MLYVQHEINIFGAIFHVADVILLIFFNCFPLKSQKGFFLLGGSNVSRSGDASSSVIVEQRSPVRTPS